MGNKVHPIGFRLGYSADWQSKWLDLKNYGKYANEDEKVRAFLMNKFRLAGVSRIDIERVRGEIKVGLHTARPGVVIGRGGAGIEDLRKQLSKVTASQVQVNIFEVRQPETDAASVASQVVSQIERRMPFRRAAKTALDNAIKARAKGMKIVLSGRLNGADIARTEKFAKGTVPLHTLRKKIDYALRVARTTFGAIGVKVWIYKDEPIIRQDSQK